MFRSSLFAIAALAAPRLCEAVVNTDGSAAGTTGGGGGKAPANPPEKVTMEDGRVVEFAGKRKMLKEVVLSEDPNGYPSVRFDFRNGKTRLFVVDKLIPQFAAHGASQKIGDETAGEDDVDDMVLAVDEIISRLTGDPSANPPISPEWTAKREGGGFAGVSVLMRALMEHSGKDEATVKAFLKPKSHAEKMALRSFPAIKVIVERLEAEKAAKAAGASKVDAGSLLAAL